MRKRLSIVVMSLAAAALLLPASPASATTCYIGEVGVDDVYCILYGTPSWELCRKFHVC